LTNDYYNNQNGQLTLFFFFLFSLQINFKTEDYLLALFRDGIPKVYKQVTFVDLWSQKEKEKKDHKSYGSAARHSYI